LATLEAAGQLRRVTASVDWDEEIGAITRANLSLGGPALLFENIIVHENTRCRKLLTSAIGNRRQVQLMLGLPEGTSDAAIVRHLREAFKKPIPPRVVETGPVKENIIEGDEIDLFQFPAPKWHGSDGGRYIDTFCGVVTEDKVTGRDNIGCYRGMIVDRDKIAKLLVPVKVGASICRGTSQSRCRSPSSTGGTTCWASAPVAHSPRTSVNGT
jgi:4-hydroxy-3-polyprenylbenzoate decarboxylase